MVRKLGAVALLSLVATGCAREGDINATGVTAVRTACPATGVPAGTGDITLFDPADSRDASAIDVTATITNLRENCGETGSDIVTTVTFDVLARRRDTAAPRTVTLPYFLTIVRGGTSVTAKRLGEVTLSFAAGEERTSGTGEATAVIARSAARLSDDIRDQITQRRRAGDENAAIDPLARPEVREAVLRASFEALVGFQLTEEQLRYNVTR